MPWQVLRCLVLLVMLIFQENQAEARPTNSGVGLVGISGSIIETPCAIDIGSRDQSIDMGNLPAGVIANGEDGPSRPFAIYLVNCTVSRRAKTLPNWQGFRITFEGQEDRGLFRVTGEARGIGLLLTNAKGDVIHPGKQSPEGDLNFSKQRLDYRLRLTGNGEYLHPGGYRTSIRFNMDYY